MANLIFPTGTSDDGEGMLLKVQLAGSTQLLHMYCLSTGYISVDETYARYVATHVTRISVYYLHLEMNE